MGITKLEELRANNANMGRLTVTTATGLSEDGSCYEDIYAFGARSFAIYNDQIEQVYDSGSEFERITAADYPDQLQLQPPRQTASRPAATTRVRSRKA
jgi:hypothetical protein